jgi:hypothetical protein
MSNKIKITNAAFCYGTVSKTAGAMSHPIDPVEFRRRGFNCDIGARFGRTWMSWPDSRKAIVLMREALLIINEHEIPVSEVIHALKQIEGLYEILNSDPFSICHEK